MAGDEPRTAFDPASRKSSNPAEESGSPPPSGKRQIGESRGEAAWLRPHQVREWFAHNDDRTIDIMMSTLMTRKLRSMGMAQSSAGSFRSLQRSTWCSAWMRAFLRARETRLRSERDQMLHRWSGLILPQFVHKNFGEPLGPRNSWAKLLLLNDCAAFLRLCVGDTRETCCPDGGSPIILNGAVRSFAQHFRRHLCGEK
jgi:hypothetical protein